MRRMGPRHGPVTHRRGPPPLPPWGCPGSRGFRVRRSVRWPPQGTSLRLLVVVLDGQLHCSWTNKDCKSDDLGALAGRCLTQPRGEGLGGPVGLAFDVSREAISALRALGQ